MYKFEWTADDEPILEETRVAQLYRRLKVLEAEAEELRKEIEAKFSHIQGPHKLETSTFYKRWISSSCVAESHHHIWLPRYIGQEKQSRIIDSLKCLMCGQENLPSLLANHLLYPRDCCEHPVFIVHAWQDVERADGRSYREAVVKCECCDIWQTRSYLWSVHFGYWVLYSIEEHNTQNPPFDEIAKWKVIAPSKEQSLAFSKLGEAILVLDGV